MGPAMQAAFDALKDVEAAVKHVVLLTDGMTSDSDLCVALGQEMAKSRISVSTVAVGEQANTQLLYDIADWTQGRFYRVSDPMSIPEIFVKEAQVVRRPMIVEQTFSPQVVYSLSETVKGLTPPLPALDGYVLTGPKGGLNQLVLTSHEADPILATCQSGLGRCAAFTSSADSRWAGQWVQWPEFARFWEQVVRWAGRPAQSADCEIFADVQGQDVSVQIEAFDEDGKFPQFAGIQGQVLTPQMGSESLALSQSGPGQYAGRFKAPEAGSYIVNVQYRRVGDEGVRLANTIVTVPFAPEFRDLCDNLPLLRPLMLIWLGLFLLDVAVRRVVIDVRAGLRRVQAWFLRLSRREQDKTISRLQATRQKLQAQWAARTAGTVVSTRYDGADRVAARSSLVMRMTAPTRRSGRRRKRRSRRRLLRPRARRISTGCWRPNAGRPDRTNTTTWTIGDLQEKTNMTMSEKDVDAQCRQFREMFVALRGQVAKVIVGHEGIVDDVLIALFGGGHVLLEGVPGLGKTLLVRTLSRAFSLEFRRIQFTPDLMPADIIGTNIVMEDAASGRREFQFQKGPIFGQIILADEINRATPKTQSAMLEAMQEHAVTSGGQIRPLPSPFMVLATQKGRIRCPRRNWTGSFSSCLSDTATVGNSRRSSTGPPRDTNPRSSRSPTARRSCGRRSWCAAS